LYDSFRKDPAEDTQRFYDLLNNLVQAGGGIFYCRGYEVPNWTLPATLQDIRGKIVLLCRFPLSKNVAAYGVNSFVEKIIHLNDRFIKKV
jgi:hypothetical protein